MQIAGAFGFSPAFDLRCETIPSRSHPVLSAITMFSTSPLSSPDYGFQNDDKKHYFTRDDRDTTMPVDESAVNDLLARRELVRHSDSNNEINQIERTLIQNHGVRIWDCCRLWSTCLSPPPQARESVFRKSALWAKRLFGPKGHVHQQIGGEINALTCSLSINDIHNLLARRTKLRKVGDYVQADAMHFELLINGVEVIDNPPMWRADGKNHFDINECSELPNTIELVRSENDTAFIRQDIQEAIHLLLEKRLDASARNDQNLVGSLTFELYQTYGVAINDDLHNWKINGDFQEPWKKPELMFPRTQPIKSATSPLLPIILQDLVTREQKPFTISPFSGRAPEPQVVARIEEILKEFAIHFDRRHTRLADILRNELWQSYEVGVNGKRRQWSVGGIFDDNGVVENIEDHALDKKPFKWAKGLSYGSEIQNDVVTENPESSKVTDPLPRNAVAVQAKPPETTTVSKSKPHPYLRLYQESKLGEVLEAEKKQKVENLIRYMESQQTSNPNIVDRLMIRLEEEHGIAFSGVTWALQVANEVPVYLPQGVIDDIPEPKLKQIQEMVRMRNVEKFEKKNKFMPNIIEGGLKSKHQVVIDDNYRVWYIDPNL